MQKAAFWRKIRCGAGFLWGDGNGRLDEQLAASAQLDSFLFKERRKRGQNYRCVFAARKGEMYRRGLSTIRQCFGLGRKDSPEQGEAECPRGG